jgi:hypothetical protein
MPSGDGFRPLCVPEFTGPPLGGGSCPCGRSTRRPGPPRTARRSAFERWLAARLAALPAPFAAEVRTWAEALQGRGPRAGRARQASTIQGYVRILQAPLASWATRYESLRQVTTDDATGQLAPLTGATRLLALSAMRSLFGTLKTAACCSTTRQRR